MKQEVYSAEAVASKLAACTIGHNVIFHHRLRSTNDAAREEMQRGAREGLVVIAEVQEEGRGRLRRHWETPEGNIALSVVLYPSIERLPYLVMMAATAVCRSIEAVTGLLTGIKWPNDVLINGKKVCGILIENELRTEGTAAAVVGIGINVRLEPTEYEDIAGTATSLENEAGGTVSRVDIIVSLLKHLNQMYYSDSDRDVLVEWRCKLVTLGKQVTATGRNNSIEGTAEDVDSSGGLVIRMADGTRETVVAGDVTLRKVEE